MSPNIHAIQHRAVSGAVTPARPGLRRPALHRGERGGRAARIHCQGGALDTSAEVPSDSPTQVPVSLFPTTIGQLPLRGGGGEPVDWRRLLASHGVASLPPNRIDSTTRTLQTTLSGEDGQSHSVVVAELQPGVATVRGREVVSPADAARILATCRRILSLDEDLSRFYLIAARDPDIAWATAGAGRMLRSPSVFEDVVKTICTTNCAWSGTERMVASIVGRLGHPDRLGEHAFPSPQAMAEVDLDFYREVARTGYRGPYLQALARVVASGDLDLEALHDPALTDAEAERRLLSLAGVGPYAAAHIMLTALGRYRLLILDSWTRPTYARLSGRAASNLAIRRRFRKFGAYQGLAFWLYLTQNWVAE